MFICINNQRNTQRNNTKLKRFKKKKPPTRLARVENRTESSGVDGTCQALVGIRNEPGCPVPSLQWHRPGDQSLRGRAKASTTLPLRTYREIIVHGAEMQRTQERATLNASRNVSVLYQCLT